MDLKSEFGKIAGDLFTLEVNTIVKANMTGEKFPSVAEALGQIADDYEKKLLFLESGSNNPPVTASGESAGSSDASKRFEELALRANAMLSTIARDSLSSPSAEADYYMRSRIRDSALRLVPLAKAPDGKLTAAELAVIRKIWELGTEEIAFQTVIQLDGDVVTRLQPKYANPSQRLVHAIHGEAVGVSVAFWKSLVELLETFFGVAIRAATGK
jgi:hypothetical protein